MRYKGDSSGHLVPTLSECMSDDRLYYGLALSFEVMSKALFRLGCMAEQSFFLKSRKYGFKKGKIGFQFRPQL